MSNTVEDQGRPEGGRRLSVRDRIVGLGVLAGLVALLIFLRTPDEPSPFARLLLPPDAPLSAEWFERAPDTAEWTSAATDYANGDYEQARKTLGDVEDAEGTDSALARLVIGTCYLIAGRPKQAEFSLRLAALTGSTAVAREARWRLAVSLLRQEELEAGRAELETLARDEGTYAPESRKLLDQLATTSSRMR